jgi:hypothetical protein
VRYATLSRVEQPSRFPLVIGFVLVVLGWAVIFIGWWQAGNQDLETGQIPYIISGGFGGFGLVVLGAIAILVDVVRQAETKLRASAEALHERLHELAESFVRDQQTTPAPAPKASSSPAKARPRRRRRRRPPAQRAE